jgi:septal ring factor EnvC (AmiA/AmiB activator)
VIQASKDMANLMVGLAKGQKEIAIGAATLDIVRRLFGIDTAPLACAVAERAPAKLCGTVARIRQLAAEMRQSEVDIQQLEADIKKLEAESARIQQENNLRMQQHAQQGNAMRQRLKDGGLFH